MSERMNKWITKGIKDLVDEEVDGWLKYKFESKK